MIFGMLKSYRFVYLTPVICSTLPREIQKGHFQQYYSYLLLIICVISEKKKTVTQLTITPENVTTLTCEMQSFSIWLKVCYVTWNVGGSEKNRLWCAATGMPGKQRHSKCSNWPPSAWYMLPVFFATDQSRRTPRCVEIQFMSQQAAAATRPYRGLVLDTRAHPITCPMYGNRPMQIMGSTKQ